eukprot:TRINITY_DN10746_c0_g1_i9.p1 TRINITY_DN10746_c0_g1~~TRINITY_DN10746_c0_g1_i9.p1  ORF type:complete len:297 (-),score=64.20 TRINITY_DN10746_c0_g1_i9:45-935(-)
MEIPSAAFIKQTITQCLHEPGNFVCKLYRSDFITHDSAIEQLFANFYRAQPYEFLTASSHKEQLKNINDHFSELAKHYERHIEEEHKEAVEKLCINRSCGNHCVGEIIGLFTDCIKDYFESTRQYFLVNDDMEMVENILSVYSNYMKFIILIESRLPSVSRLIKKVKSTAYPFSLWKFLYSLFLENVLVPVKNQLLEIFTKEAKSARETAITKVIENKKSLFVNYDQMCQLRGIAFLLICDSIDERTVHFLGSSNGQFSNTYKVIEQFLQAQTQQLYKHYNAVSYTHLTLPTICSV